jgi:hypothetical protein
LSGSSGTNPMTNYLGTSDNQPLELWVNGARALRLEPTSSTPNINGGYSGNSVTVGVQGAGIGEGGEGVYENTVTDHYGTVGGGRGNQAGDNAGDLYYAHYATVGGGYYNDASGDSATVGGGYANDADGNYSFAAGRRAQANFEGAFVWADSSDHDFSAIYADIFNARATEGFYLVAGIGSSGATTWSCSFTNGNSWSCSSDRAMKENFREVDRQAILEKLSRVPVQTWNAKGTDPNIMHLGPTAQDFYGAFGLGDDDKRISTIDLDGVALVAIQGLYTVSQEQAQQIESLQLENNALQKQITGNHRGSVPQLLTIVVAVLAGMVLLLTAGFVWLLLRFRKLGTPEASHGC